MSYRNLLLGIAMAALLGVAGAVSCELEEIVTCDETELNLATGHVGDFGDTDNARKIESFFHAVDTLENKAQDLANRMVTACKAIGNAVGLTEAELSPTGGETGNAARIEAACGEKLQTRIKQTIQAAIPRGAFLTLTYEPPVCTAKFDTYKSCVAGCNVQVTPGTLQAECEPGAMGIGVCTVDCKGDCWLDAGAQCDGRCTAICTGSCDGACYGRCDGSPVNGTVCSGQCEGRCGGTCRGSCSEECIVRAEGRCAGTCHSRECTAWAAPPRCEVYARPGTVDAQCHASCQARVRADLECTEPQLLIDYGNLGGDPQAQERLGALVNALREHYPEILVAAAETGDAIVRMVESCFEALDAFADDIEAMVDAAACAVAALEVSAQVTLTFQTSLSTSGGIAGSVAVEGNAQVGK